MAEGSEVGKAYITISLEDTTEGDYEVIKSRLEAEPAIVVKATLDDPDVTKAREEAQAAADAEPDVKLKAKVDEDVLSQSVKDAGAAAIPAAEDAGAKLGDSSGKSAIQYGTQRMGEMATVYTAAFLAVSPGIGGALISGVALGVIGIAAELDKSNAEVAAQYAELGSTVKSVFGNAAATLVVPISDAVDKVNATVHTLGPGIAQAFGQTGPAVGELADGIDELATNAMPGFEAATKASGTVMNGLSAILADTGTAFSQTMELFSSNSTATERDFESFGTVIEDVLNLVSHVANDAASAWSTAAGAIDPALHNLVQDFDGLASGALPVAGEALNLVATDVEVILRVLGPLTPIIGAAGAAFLVFKTASSIVSALGSGIVSLGGFVSTTADKIGGMVAAQEGLTLESSASAKAISAFGDASAATAADVGLLTESLAGPLGIALLAGTALISLFAGSSNSASSSTADLSQQIIQLGQAGQSSAAGMLSSSTQLQAVDSDLKTIGSTASAFAQAFSGSLQQANTYVDGLSTAQSKLGTTMATVSEATATYNAQGQISAEVNSTTTQTIADLAKQVAGSQTAFNSLSPTVQGQINTYNSYAKVLQQAKDAQKALQEAQSQASAAANTTSALQAESSAASALGLSVNDVKAAYTALIAANPSESLQATALAFDNNILKADQAASSITTYFQQQDAAVVSANQSLTSANESYVQSQQSVTSAIHSAGDAAFSVTQAYQSLASAEHTVTTSQESLTSANIGVTTAQQQLTTAQQSAVTAQTALNTAYQTAAQDLINLNLQLNDQTESAQAANLALFNQQTTAGALGINAANAQAIAAQTVTSSNEAQIQAALDLISAQNTLADAQNSLTQTQSQNNAAQTAGVDGSTTVISAQAALVSAQQQVVSATQAVTQAQQSQQNAAFSLQQAVEGVTNAQHSLSDAEYTAQQAEQAITSARQQEANALLQVQTAQKNLQTARDNDTRSLDLSTVAGQQNMSMVLNLASALQSSGIPQASQYNDLINDVAPLFGNSTTAAENYLKQIGLIQPNYKFGVTAVASADLTGLQSSYQKIITQISGTGATGSNVNVPPQSLSNLLGFADGGPVQGPGGPRDDQVLARVSPGEFIVNASSASKNLGLLNHINKFADGGPVEAVGANAGLSTMGVDFTAGVDALGVMGLGGPAGMPAYVAPATPTASSGGPSGVVPAVPSSRAANEAIVQSVFSSMFGWTGPEWNATIQLLMQESGFNNVAQNPTSTAYGMFQFLNSTWGGYGVAKTSDPTQQSIAGGRYIKARYGDPLGAEAHEQSYHWFESGGYLMPGATAAANGTGKKEMVLPPSMTSTMEALDSAVSSGGRPRSSGGSVTTNNIQIQTIPQNPTAIANVVSSELSWVGRSRRG